MKACLDVFYSRGSATAAALVFEEWSASAFVSAYTVTVPQLAAYEPGKFYRRELGPLLAVIAKIDVPIDVYVIDGYCHLSAARAPGLGAYLKKALPSTISVIGVAKSRYGNSDHAIELLRAQSRRPLFVTAIGIDYEQAAQYIASMAGAFRIPTLLKAVDHLTRTATTRAAAHALELAATLPSRSVDESAG